MSYEPQPFGGNDDLADYVRLELRAIADEINQAQGAASLYRSVLGASVALTTAYTKFNQFTNFTPLRDYRAVQPLLPSDIYVRRVGLVACSFVLTLQTPSNQGYACALFVNDVETALVSVVDPSNQTVEETLTAIGTFRVVSDPALNRVADKFDLRLRMLSGTGNYTPGPCYFSVWYLGD